MSKRQMVQDIVSRAQRVGRCQAEVYMLDAKSLNIEVANEQVETFKLAEENGIGVRTISEDGRIGFAYSADMSTGAVERMIDQALHNAVYIEADPFQRLPECMGNDYHDVIDPKLAQVPVDDKISLALQTERAARQQDQRIMRTERSVYEDVDFEVVVANSNGSCVSYRSGFCGLYASVLAEDGNDVQYGTGMSFQRNFDNLHAASVGCEAANDAVRLLGAVSIDTQMAALVMSPQIATEFMGVLAPALTADAVQKGRSLFQGKLGHKVLADGLTFIDDGSLKGGVASTPFDGEGVPARRTILIQGGVLHGFLHNTYTAAKDHVQSTGNAVRSSFMSLPEVGTTNFYIDPGSVKPDDLIAEVPKGLYVTSVMGMHTANPITGDFSVGAAGLWIENGQFVKPVRGVAIAGNLLELLASVDAVGNDLRFFGSTGAPTLRIPRVSISGS